MMMTIHGNGPLHPARDQVGPSLAGEKYKPCGKLISLSGQLYVLTYTLKAFTTRISSLQFPIITKHGMRMVMLRPDNEQCV